MQLHEYHRLPQGLLNTPARQLFQALPGPALIHLPGRHKNPLFLSVLLHGNETTGWDSVRSLLSDWSGHLPRSISLFIGNIEAAARGLRRLETQPDYNRVWRNASGPEANLARQVIERMSQKKVFASVDIHNTSGNNPAHVVITQLEKRVYGLASLFSDKLVYILNPDTTLCRAFEHLCPSVTLECGKPDNPEANGRVKEFLKELLSLSRLPELSSADVDLYRTTAKILVNEHMNFGFRPGHALVLREELQDANFQVLQRGTTLGFMERHHHEPLIALNTDSQNVTREYFEITDDEVRLSKDAIPAMYTPDLKIIRQDCLCYLMERIGG